MMRQPLMDLLPSMPAVLSQKVLIRTLALVALPFYSTARLKADTISLTPLVDTTLFQTSPNNNLGGTPNFIAGTTSGGGRNRALLKFDIAGQLPANAVITSVSLTMVDVSNSSSFTPSTFNLHRVLVDWGEGNKTGNQGQPASAGEATWNARFFGMLLWTVPGAEAGSDFAVASSGATFIAVTGASTFTSTPGLVTDVQSWLDDPTNNFGWMLLSDAESTLETSRRFGSSEDTLGRMPGLRIDFTPVPEPGALALFTLAAAAFWEMRHRRKR